MSSKSVKVFTLAQANDLVPLVASLTSEVVGQLEALRKKHSVDLGSDSVPAVVMKQVEEVLQGWAESVTEVGASPKGYFTVDFQSLDPELLYCWTYGEDKISYTHKVWENFNHRRPLEESLQSPSSHLKWVN